MTPSAASRILQRRMERVRERQADLIGLLRESGHSPDVKGVLGLGGESSGGTQAWIECNRCRRRRRKWLPERWQPLSVGSPCPGTAPRRFQDGTPVPDAPPK